MEIYAATLDDLIQGLSESNEPGDPEVVDNLWLSVTTGRDDAASEFPKNIRVEISPSGLTLSISGDPAWARSKVDHLRSLIEDAQEKRRLWSLSPEFTGVLFAALSWMAYAVVLVVAGVDLSGKGGRSLWSVAPLVVCPAFAYFIGFIVGTRVVRRHQTTLWISESMPPPQVITMTKFERLTIFISIASLIAAIVFGYLGYHKDEPESGKKDKAHSSVTM
ncbi:hypothetical protein [Streptomyces sp. NPDC016626]|uniref:hypothetical protein n=1 Tax=Streptomyces sp. NPDC016626 TaxID=3364968 RepID=UPI0036FE03A8